MGKLSLFLLIVLLYCIDPICEAQSTLQVSDPRLELRGNTLHISYNILNSKSSDYFEVGVEISDDEGNILDASSLRGDIGKGLSGGVNKSIQWDLGADHIVMDEKIYCEVRARTMANIELAQIGKKNVVEESPGAENMNTASLPPANISKSFSGAGIVIQSLFIPGLGLSRVTGNPHWLRGLAGYGCLAGAVVYNRLSYNTYNGIEDYPDYDDRNEQLQKSINQDDISEILAYAAIGIWATDFIWNLIGISSFKKRSMLGEFKGISIRPGIDTLTYAPTVGIKYSF